jgi:hypothetical protein
MLKMFGVPSEGATMLDDEGLMRRTAVVGSVIDAFTWRKQLLRYMLSCMEGGTLKGHVHGVGWPKAMAWVGVGVGWAGHGGGVGHMPRGKLGYL